MEADFATGERASFVPSFRCFLVVSFLLYLINGPVARESDVVASVLALSLLSLLLITASIVFLRGRALRRALRLSVSGPSGEQVGADSNSIATVVRSKEPALFVLKVNALSVWPFFVLHLRVEFDNEGMEALNHHVTGATKVERTLPRMTEFPHRGRWSVKQVVVRFSDQFEFFSLRWKVAGENICKTFEVHPPLASDTNLPILSSSHRPGDAISDLNDRRGDPYDIKQYHPSDGIKKILWKVFAKRGELMARHPEPSITPEGQVIIFTMANREEDHVCSATDAYLRTLENLDLQIFHGCEGMGKVELARTRDTAMDLMISSVWATDEATPDSAREDLQHLLRGFTEANNGASIERVLIFAGTERLSSRAGMEQLVSIAETLSSSGIKPVISLGGTQQFGFAHAEAKPPHPGHLNRVASWFTIQPASIQNFAGNHQAEFMGICLRNQWQVII